MSIKCKTHKKMHDTPKLFGLIIHLSITRIEIEKRKSLKDIAKESCRCL